MKKLVLTILLYSPVLVFCQQSSIGISGGYASNGIGTIAEYNHYFKERSIINSSIYYSFSSINEKGQEINFSDITLNVGYFYRVLKTGKSRFSINLGGGGVAGYEVINNGSNTLDSGAILNAESKAIFGAYVGSQINYFISNYFSLSLVTNQFYHANSDIGELAFYTGVGIKYFVF